MAYRGIRGSDPFASKTTRNERFAQMSKQEQLIEQKKREIQAKLEDQKKKETEEALKKLQGVSGNCRPGPGNRSNSHSGQHKVNRKPFWKRYVDILYPTLPDVMTLDAVHNMLYSIFLNMLLTVNIWVVLNDVFLFRIRW
jgi:hypothetical protein